MPSASVIMDGMTDSVLKVEKLVKDYGDYRAVDNISFEIKKGQILGLLGPNGAGKTTTIQILVGITNMSSGKISYFGKDFQKYRQASLQRINSTSAYNTLLGRITVMENMMTFAGLYRVKDRRKKITELLERFEVSHLAQNRYQELSAGERTRVNLAKSLLNDPELLLMDEPTASLDPDIADKTLAWVEQLRSQHNVSILFTSHNMSEVEQICDDVIFLDRGKIVSQGSPADHTKKFDKVEIALTFKAPYERIIKILDSKKLSYQSHETGRVSIYSPKEEAAVIIAELVDAGIKISNTQIHQPDLKQVFI